MSSKFDRLERFFSSRRKTSPSSVESLGPSTQAVEPQFPSPSFIRPKTSRMTARDEVRFRQANERSPSVPDIRSHRLGSYPRNQALPTPDSTSRFPLRSPSFNGQCLEPLLMELNEFQFPTPPSRSGDLTPMSMTFGSSTSDITQPPSPRSRSPKTTGMTPCLDSPTPSHLRDPRCLPRIKIPTNTLPTPQESPQLGPVPGSPLSDLDLKPTSFDDFQDQLDDAFGQFYPDAFGGDSGLGSPSSYHRLTYCSFTLREPDFNDFLNLSDDDIAESALDSPTPLPRNDWESLPPIVDLSVFPSERPDSFLLTLSPPRASRPAESGALMAARIAKRYDFDLIYIVNLWPGNRAYQILDPDFERPENPLKGRLLAAHGLQNVPSPLQISSQVHKTILGSDGWIEYRNTAAQPDELARGYARAFYTGAYTKTSTGSTSGPASSNVDRGIVFAAYRKPRPGDASSQGYTEEQLSDIHDEAETLVNVLLDIHAQNRGRQPPTSRRLSDETGPMPFF